MSDARQNTDETVTGADAPAVDAPIHVEGGDHFDTIVADHDVVLVDFYADWCGPCKMLEPIVESIAADTEAVVAKVDVDEYQDLAQRFSVQGIPTLLLYAGGEQVERLVGMRDESSLRDFIAQYT